MEQRAEITSPKGFLAVVNKAKQSSIERRDFARGMAIVLDFTGGDQDRGRFEEPDRSGDRLPKQPVGAAKGRSKA